MTFFNTHAPAGHRLCRSLRCKEMYYTAAKLDHPNKGRVESCDEDARAYWCTQSCRPLAPDGGDLGLDACGPDRSCYRA